tara:strand:- start:170 stop:697 length:528 start_codon:yes stop_codon:yes gene_type:complete
MSGIIGLGSTSACTGIVDLKFETTGAVLQTANATIDGADEALAMTSGWDEVGLSATLPRGLIQQNAKVLLRYSQCIEMYNSSSSIMIQLEDSIAGASYVEVMDSQSFQLIEDMVTGQWRQLQSVCTGFVKQLTNDRGASYAVKVMGYETTGSTYTHADYGRNSRRSHLTIQEIAR